jgi:NADH-quinone oxidoreductase subunit C
MPEPSTPDPEEKSAAASDSTGAERALADAPVPGAETHLDGQSAAPAGPATPEPTTTQKNDGAKPPDGDGLLHGQPTEDAPGTTIVHTGREGYLALCTSLKADGYAMMIGVSGVDYLTHPGRRLPAGITPERFEVVVELLSLLSRHRVRVRCQVAASDTRLPTLFDLWPGAEAHEREVYDMFGVVFDNHPDMTRILMPEDWEGHPLRKDYATGHIPVQFKEAPSGR